jgi:hypothetical protein
MLHPIGSLASLQCMSFRPTRIRLSDDLFAFNGTVPGALIF